MSSHHRQVIRLTKQVENRLCADCECTLGTGKSYASLTFGIWICPSCHEVHLHCLPDCERFKCSQDNDWEAREYNTMLIAGSNVKQNALLEKYLMPGWPKITMESSFIEKVLWTRAKYEARLFTFPRTSQDPDELGSFVVEESSSSVSDTKQSNRSEETLPTRLAEMVLLLGPSRCRTFDDSSPIGKLTDIALNPVVINCVRADDSVGRTPELVGHCVFPLGIHLSNQEQDPKAFSFVLTNESRVKLYGVTLHFFELLEQDELELLFGSKFATALSEQFPILYAPKALTVISYYPFFHLFRETLLSIYRVSLSTAPFPLERLVFNFLKEVPLPPEGVVLVVYPLPDRVLQICRPPPNKLPMVDYSFLPLFLSLSVDNIITAFRCLCAEMSVCILSHSLALLTPAQEALLSLLFPLHWQGCYIPVMPMHMADILEAPVPILVGLHSSYLSLVPEVRRPPHVVFINLDDDTIQIGGSGPQLTMETNRVQVNNFGSIELIDIPCLEKSVLIKLKGRLEEVAGNFLSTVSGWQQRRLELSTCDIAFKNQEHLTPIKKYYDTGLGLSSLTSQTLHTVSASWCCTQVVSSQLNTSGGTAGSTSSSSRPNSMNASGAGNGFGAAGSRTIFGRFHLLDPASNFFPDGSFQSTEIRLAFLRVFIKSLSDYREYTRSSGSLPNTTSALAQSTQRPNSKAILLSTGGSGHFDAAAFNAAHPHDPFTSHLITTQMFSKFVQEDAGEHPEKRYFLESITKKRNRSVISNISHGKEATPFLDDTSEYLSETCRAPEPSNWGLSFDQQFTYSQFPILDPSLSGPIRPVPTLVRNGQKIRELGSSVQAIGRLLDHSSGGKHGRITAAQIQDFDQAMNWEKDHEKDRTLRMQLLIASYSERNRRLIKVLTSMQAVFRGYLWRSKFRRFKRCVRTFQMQLRRALSRKQDSRCLQLLQRLKGLIAARKIFNIVRKFWGRRILVIIRLQSIVRSWLIRLRFKTLRRQLVCVQCLWRKYHIQNKYLILRRSVCRAQKYMRAYTIRRLTALRLTEIVEATLLHIVSLWELYSESLVYRTRFWVEVRALLLNEGSQVTRNPSSIISKWIIVGILRAEIVRLAKGLGFDSLRAIECWEPLSDKKSCCMLRVKRPSLPSTTGKFEAKTQLMQTTAVSVQRERDQLYRIMKTKCTPKLLDGLYSHFPDSVGKKKRKHTLSSILWRYSSSFATIDNYALVTTTVDGEVYGNLEPTPRTNFGGAQPLAAVLISQLKSELIHRACGAATLAILKASRSRGK